MTSEEVQNVLLAIASGARTFGGLSDSTAGTALSAAAGLITGVAGLLKRRTPEEVKALIYDMAADPADMVDLDGLDAKVAEIIAARRASDGD